MVVAESQVVPHYSFDFKPEDPVVKASLHHFIFSGLLESLYKPMHLAGGSIKDSLGVSYDLLFSIVLIAHEIFEVPDGSVGFKHFFSDWTSCVLILS